MQLVEEMEEARPMNEDGAADITAVRSWYVAHAADIYAYAARRVGRDLADDIVADTFRHALESLDGFDRERGGERAWLFGIATNLLRRHWRTEQRRRAALERAATTEHLDREPSDVVGSTVGQLDAKTDAADVLAAVSELSPKDYELLVLTAWEEMSSHEAAAVLKIPAGTVRSRLHRIRKQLDSARRRSAPVGDDPKGERP